MAARSSELRELLARIDEGILTDGDMDFPLSNILDALERWIAFLETGERDEVYELAIRSIERVDFHIEADMNDMLATPEMAAELERIRRALTTGWVPKSRRVHMLIRSRMCDAAQTSLDQAPAHSADVARWLHVSPLPGD